MQFLCMNTSVCLFKAYAHYDKHVYKKEPFKVGARFLFQTLP